MKKIIIFLLLITIFSCTQKKDYSSELNDLMLKWTLSTRNFDFEVYKNHVEYIKNEQQFRMKFNEFYYSTPIVYKIEILDDKKEPSEFKIFVSMKQIMRDKTGEISDINGIFEVDRKKENFIIRRHIIIKDDSK